MVGDPDPQVRDDDHRLNLATLERLTGWSPPPNAIAVGVLLYQGIGGLSLSVFTENTPPPGAAGGLLNAIMGSIVFSSSRASWLPSTTAKMPYSRAWAPNIWLRVPPSIFVITAS